ncbi:hypothetical protein EVAR_17652_1 [Eumeta japonica]|uniref:Uncharacterized protein n=1 Tax=Eumeta variegata TaxID=151549 RepID=A0A4C1UT03_EUMVA|nr:hypothetical protein EVAR_17652_1 [Eumeta japonica]
MHSFIAEYRSGSDLAASPSRSGRSAERRRRKTCSQDRCCDVSRQVLLPSCRIVVDRKICGVSPYTFTASYREDASPGIRTQFRRPLPHLLWTNRPVLAFDIVILIRTDAGHDRLNANSY